MRINSSARFPDTLPNGKRKQGLNILKEKTKSLFQAVKIKW